MAMTQQEPVQPRIPEWSFGDRLKKAREDSGLDQKAMAAHFDVSVSTISSWESDGGAGRTHSQLEVITVYAELTGVDASWLAGFRSR
jgi:transcriptional regulator with XRE-family HTH domain